jgi:hypothetical protein
VTTINRADGGVPTIYRIPGEIVITNPDGSMPGGPGTGPGGGPGGGPGTGPGPGTGTGPTVGPDGKGDCDKDGRLTLMDARCALQMSVGNRTRDLLLDMPPADGDVTSRDATLIAQRALRAPGQ